MTSLETTSGLESTHSVVRAGKRLGALADRRRGLLTAAGSVLAVGALVFVLAGRWDSSLAPPRACRGGR